MGSTGSRPRVTKVAPCKSEGAEGEQQHRRPKPQWTLPALEQHSGSHEHRRTTLPPLKQEITLSTLSDPCFAGSLTPNQSNKSSIIHAHPPRRHKALALQIGHTTAANQIVTGCRDGGVQQFSTAGQTGHSGTGRPTQGGFLEAQIALSQQAHRHRRAHLRQAREQRRHKVVYTVNVGDPSKEGVQRLKLVRRPTERDIFWDESTGESLDPSCLLEPSSLPRSNQLSSRHLCKVEDLIPRDHALCPQNNEGKAIHQTAHSVLSPDKTFTWTTHGERQRIEDEGATAMDGWMWPESVRGSKTGRIRGAGGIWSAKLE